MEQNFAADSVFFGAKSGALIKLSSDAVEFKDPLLQNEIDTKAWALWGAGDNNGFLWAEKMRKCGVLTAAIEGKARIAIGRGLRPVVVTGIDAEGTEKLEFINDPEIDEWMLQNHAFKNSVAAMRNVIGWGWNHQRIILNGKGDKIALYKTDDIVKCRMGKKDTTSRKIEKTYYSPNFSNGYTAANDKDEQYVKTITVLEEGNELEHLKKLIESGTAEREFSIIYRSNLDGNEYYPTPLWYSTIDWVDMIGKIPAMKVAMMNNEITVKYIIRIDPQYFSRMDAKWDSYPIEKKQAMFNEKAAAINQHLSGTDNAYKSIVDSFYIDPATGKQTPYITIEVIDDKNREGKLLIDSSAGNKEILFSMMLNPAIIGANTFGSGDGGAGSGSDIREAYLVQIMLMEAERQMNNHIFNIVKHINGWATKYPGLQFRYPNSVLTTLDKGGSLKPSN